MSGRRWCFFIPADAFVDGCGFVPSVVTEGEAGHSPLTGTGAHAAPYYWGMTYEAARAAAAQQNERLGHTPADVAEIIASSMAGGDVQP